ncbi:hypothetical protein [Hyphococcus luteus]|uniref:hypothetical protein n=1 Tax=Hyphococcus luteus TaxID=2058213 RepID=UPI001056F6C3|nr:hypothetical protein [Marinicaulis flavus]
MKHNSVVLTRKELYDLVWSKPMVKVASDFNISDVAMKKVCKKNNIPVPPRGYWRRVETGKPVKQIKLPKVENAPSIAIDIRQRVEEIAKEFMTEEITQKIFNESEPESKILVPHFLTHPHKITTITKHLLKAAKEDEYGAIKCLSEEAFYVRIGPASTDRVLRIIDTFLKACEERGFTIRAGEKRDNNRYIDHAKLIVDGEALGFSIEETIRRRPHKLTEKELAHQRKNNRSWSDYSYLHIPNYDFFPTGKLTLKIDGHYGSRLRSTWNDTKRQWIEDRLNEVIVALLEASAWIKQRRKKQKEKEQRHQKELARRAEIRKRYDEECAAISQLETEATNWRQSENIRAYAAAFELRASENGQLTEAQREWLLWAREHTDRLDPLCETKPSSLDTSEEDMRPISIWEMADEE